MEEEHFKSKEEKFQYYLRKLDLEMDKLIRERESKKKSYDRIVAWRGIFYAFLIFLLLLSFLVLLAVPSFLF